MIEGGFDKFVSLSGVENEREAVVQGGSRSDEGEKLSAYGHGGLGLIMVNYDEGEDFAPLFLGEFVLAGKLIRVACANQAGCGRGWN